MKIWIATGGTGGHIFPALAVANELLTRGNNVIVSSDGRGMSLVRKGGGGQGSRISAAFVWASGISGKSRLVMLVALFKIVMSAVGLALRWVFARPDRVVAFGGYASVPVVLAARIWKIPTLLHEQNAAIGMANRFAMKWVGVLMTSFPKVAGIPAGVREIVYTGLPVRKEFAECKVRSAARRVLITGGSLGAAILDKIVPGAILRMKKRPFIIHQTRPENVARLQKFYADNKIKANVLSFIHDMAGELAAASLVIGRSGASTIAELQVVGRPAILVPLSINPDQLANARAFEKQGAGLCVSEDKFTEKWLSTTLEELFANPARLQKMTEKAHVPNNAVNKIVAQIVA